MHTLFLFLLSSFLLSTYCIAGTELGSQDHGEQCRSGYSPHEACGLVREPIVPTFPHTLALASRVSPFHLSPVGTGEP